ncbi:uncharacterized protein DS421_12g353510 [Arachis hypogaea]|nr:uncharacterized protein DS421_12g353510 [Arachis hypogaea]
MNPSLSQSFMQIPLKKSESTKSKRLNPSPRFLAAVVPRFLVPPLLPLPPVLNPSSSARCPLAFLFMAWSGSPFAVVSPLAVVSPFVVVSPVAVRVSVEGE